MAKVLRVFIKLNCTRFLQFCCFSCESCFSQAAAEVDSGGKLSMLLSIVVRLRVAICLVLRRLKVWVHYITV